MAEKRSLCELHDQGFLKDEFKAYKKLVRKSRYICTRCGRTARKKTNLCRPAEL